MHKSDRGARSFRDAARNPDFLVVVLASLFWVWFSSVHDMYPYMRPHLQGQALHASQVVCLSQPSGLVAGALALRLVLARGAGRRLSPRAIRGAYGVLGLCHVIAWGNIALGGADWRLTASTQFACSFIAAFFFGLLLRKICALGGRCERLSIFCAIVLSAVMVFLERVSGGALGAAEWALLRGTLLLAPLLACAGLCWRRVDLSWDGDPRPSREAPAKTPRPLAVHLLLYGLTFGMLHMLAGVLGTPTLANLLMGSLGMLAIAGAFYWLFMREARPWRIWETLRAVLFPLTIVGFILVPTSSSNGGAAAIVQASELLYNAMFVFGCMTVIGKTALNPCLVAATGLAWKSAGVLLGGAFAVWGLDGGRLLVGETHIALSALVVLMLTVGTFWVGSDRDIHRVWGLWRRHDPKYLHDEVLKRQCDALAEKHQLTPREQHILLLLVQGKRPAQIAEDCTVSIHTVRAHVRGIHAKLDAHSTADIEAMLKAIPVSESTIAEEAAPPGP